MLLSKEKRFLYTRIAILVATAGWIGSAFAGLKGFPLWYGGFVLCFWAAFGLLNYRDHSSVWLVLKRPSLFALLYVSLAGVLFLTDTFGLNSHLWFYPFYNGLGLLWVWLVLYPFGGLSLLEMLYFLTGCVGESLCFIELPMMKYQKFLDVLEHALFLITVAVITLGAIGVGGLVVVFSAFSIAALWILSLLFKIRLYLCNFGQYLLIIILAVMLGILSHMIPHTIAREWIYLEAPFLSSLILGLPLWLWVGSFWFTLVPLRLWMFLELHSKINLPWNPWRKAVRFK